MQEGFPESIFGPEDRRLLEECLGHLLAGRTVALKISDSTLVEPVQNALENLANRVASHPGTELKFRVFDFHKRSPAEIVSEIDSKFPQRGPHFASKHPGIVFVIVDPKTQSSVDFNKVSSIAKWAPTVIIQPRQFEDYDTPIQRMLGEYVDITFSLG